MEYKEANLDDKSNPYSLVSEKVLVACPTYRGKSYALEAYISAYNDFSYPYKDLFMVDNTGTGLEYYKHLKGLGVPCDHINPTANFQETFAMCWKRIMQRAVELDFQWVMSIEQDNICPPLALDAMLNIAGFCRALHVAHSYPWHKTQAEQGLLLGLGCNLISTEVLKAIFAQDKWFTNAIESEIYEYPKLMGYPTVEVHNVLKIEHLDDDKQAEFCTFRGEHLPLMGNNVGEFKPRQYNKGLH